MPIDPVSGKWFPKLSDKQKQVYNCYKRYILSSGPRLTGKTLGSMQRIVRHAWETDRARVAMFSKTIKRAKSGVWSDINDITLKEWIDSKVEGRAGPIEYTRLPGPDGNTRVNY